MTENKLHIKNSLDAIRGIVERGIHLGLGEVALQEEVCYYLDNFGQFPFEKWAIDRGEKEFRLYVKKHSLTGDDYGKVLKEILSWAPNQWNDGESPIAEP